MYKKKTQCCLLFLDKFIGETIMLIYENILHHEKGYSLDIYFLSFISVLPESAVNLYNSSFEPGAENADTVTSSAESVAVVSTMLFPVDAVKSEASCNSIPFKCTCNDPGTYAKVLPLKSEPLIVVAGVAVVYSNLLT